MAPNNEIPIGFTGETFPAGIHMCLESGLLNGKNVSYFMDINTADEMTEHQAALGVDKLHKETTGTLFFSNAEHE